MVCFANPPDSDLSSGQRYSAIEQPGPGQQQILPAHSYLTVFSIYAAGRIPLY